MKVTLRLPEAVLDGLRQVALVERRSLTTTVIIAAEEYLKRKLTPPPEPEAHHG